MVLIMNQEDKKLNNTNTDLEQSSKKAKKKKSNRCLICNKRTGIIPFICKCSLTNMYCSLHRCTLVYI